MKSSSPGEILRSFDQNQFENDELDIHLQHMQSIFFKFPDCDPDETCHSAHAESRTGRDGTWVVEFQE